MSNLFSPEIVYIYPGTYTVKLRVGRGTENAETEMLKYEMCIRDRFRGQPVKGSCDAIATSWPSDDIRMVTLKINSSQILLDDCISTPWMESSPANVADFSATAYFFANYLRKVLKVPVGVICSSWGGSKIESWINKEVYMEKFPEISLSALTKDPKDIARPKDEPTLLYLSLIHI